MHEKLLADAARLPNDALFARLKVLAGGERDATVELVAHLSELHARRTHLGEGWGSVFVYCRTELHLSEDAAYNRVATARAVRRFPIILDRLADGSLNVTAVKLLRPVLTPENHLAILAEAKHRSNKQVRVIAARLAPRPDVPSSIRKLPTPTAVVPPSVSSPSLPLPLPLHRIETEALAPHVVVPPAHRPIVEPLAPERYRIQFTVSKATHDRLRRVQDLLRREIPDADPAAIFDRALLLLEREVERRKVGATTKPRPPRGSKDGSRAIPAHVRRAVWRRDEGRCAFDGKGRRCTERAFLEWHHVQPFGHQGPATVENISLRCRAHNAYEGELVFGRFDPSVVRETLASYAVSEEIAPFQNGGGATAGRHQRAQPLVLSRRARAESAMSLAVIAPASGS